MLGIAWRVRLGASPLQFGPDDYTPIAIAGSDEEIAARIAEIAGYGMDEVILYTFPLGAEETARLPRIIEALRRTDMMPTTTQRARG